MVFSRVRRGNDHTDRLLVEAFEPTMALEIFQMAAQGALAGELIELCAGDQPRRQKTLRPFGPHRPAFAISERLAQEIEIGERLHRVDSALLQLLAQEIELKPRFQVVHSGLEEALAMQPYP